MTTDSADKVRALYSLAKECGARIVTSLPRRLEDAAQIADVQMLPTQFEDFCARLLSTAPQGQAGADVPEDVMKAAKYMTSHGYQGPLAYASMVFDWVVSQESP